MTELSDDRGSVSRWLDLLKDGDSSAADELWRRYFKRLVVLARGGLNPRVRRVTDEEDVAVSVFDTLCRHARQGSLTRLHDRNALWRMLAVMVRHKIIDLHRKEVSHKRGGGEVRGDSVFHEGARHQPRGFNDVIGTAPTPDDIVCLQEDVDRLLQTLDNPQLREIARARLNGETDQEVAARLHLSIRTVERKIRLIRATWLASWE